MVVIVEETEEGMVAIGVKVETVVMEMDVEVMCGGDDENGCGGRGGGGGGGGRRLQGRSLWWRRGWWWCKKY